MNKILLGTIAPIALAIAFSGAAYADGIGDVSATVSGSYGGTTSAGTAKIYGANGTINIPFDVSVADVTGVEGDIDLHSVDYSGDVFNAGGALYVGGASGRLAAGYWYHQSKEVGNKILNQVGGGGQWFVSPDVDLAVNVGGILSHNNGGGYVGGQLKWYVVPDVSVSASLGYVSYSRDVTTAKIEAEWLISESVPVAVYGGYQNINNIKGVKTGKDNVLYVGLRLYVNGGSAETLVDRQRTGSLGFVTQSPIAYDQY